MKQITYLYIAIFFSISQYANTTITEYNKVHFPQENIKAPQATTFNELMNLKILFKDSNNTLARRKGDIKYSDLKVYWKTFIENLDKKRRNPDQAMLDKRNLIS